MITEGPLTCLPAETVEAFASESVAMSGIRYWLTDLTSPGFDRVMGTDSFRAVQDMRASAHLDGAQILDALHRNGWTSIRRWSYVTDVRGFRCRLPSHGGPRPPGFGIGRPASAG